MNSYVAKGFSVARKVIANCDKTSRFGQSKVVNSPWGVFRMYKVSVRGGKKVRWFSLSGSKVFHNGGSYKIGTIKRMLRKYLDK